MKVTLAYFVEPNLTGEAATRPDTCRSYGLRFAMKERDESEAAFRARVNAGQEKDGTVAEAETSCRLLGPKAIQAGSPHCDLWRGYAIDLAGHDALAVYPVGGWWRSRLGQRRTTDTGRYALVISISAPGHALDLHAEVADLVGVREIEALVGRTSPEAFSGPTFRTHRTRNSHLPWDARRNSCIQCPNSQQKPGILSLRASV